MEKKKNKKRTFSDYVAFIVVIVAIIWVCQEKCVSNLNITKK